MPTKKKTATGPKAKLMKKNLAQLKAQAKKLKIKGFSTKKKEALVNSIMMAQARNNKGKATTKTRKISSAVKGPNAALIKALEKMSPGQRRDLMKMYGMAEKDYTPTGTRSSIKRMAKKRGAPANRVMRNPARTGRQMMGQRQTYYEIDLSNFSNRELRTVAFIINQYLNDELTERARRYFYDEGLKIGFNTNSGKVFLTNEDYQVLLINDYEDRELDLFISTPYSGEEGFYDDLMDIYEELDPEDQEYLDSLK